MSNPPIAILGAGICGLTLSRSLRNSGIPFKLYDHESSFASHNYGITLHPRALSPLLKILEINEDQFRRRVAVDRNRGGVRGQGHVFPSGSGRGLEDSIRVHRGKLEELLREGLDVRWNSDLLDAGSRSDDGIWKRAIATGGKRSFGRDFYEGESLFVDTRGVHSPSKLGRSENRVLPFVVFRGTRTIGKKEWKKKYQNPFGDGNMLVKRKKDMRLEVSVNDYRWDGAQVDISYIYSRPVRTDDMLYNPGRSPSEASSIPEELWKEVFKLMNSNLEEPFKDVFHSERMKQDRLLHWLMRSSMMSKYVAGLRAAESTLRFVTLGDAAHAHPILGGEGANEAILDGNDLGVHIAEHRVNDLQQFFEPVYKRWERSVEESEKALWKMHGVQMLGRDVRPFSLES